MNRRAKMMEWKRFGDIQHIYGPLYSTITHVTYDSRKIIQGGCFVCLLGSCFDGHHFIHDAIRRGASTIVGRDKEALQYWHRQYPLLTFLFVKDSKVAMAEYASHLYGDTHKYMNLFGVTGTNGKTTITAYIHSLLNQLGENTGIIGTSGIWDKKQEIDFENTTPTTPESPDLHGVLSSLYKKGTKTVAMEATSIAIEQKRLYGIEYTVGIHSNFTSDHLDFHGTMENYKKAKLKLFRQSKIAVVNMDDQLASEILDMFKGSVWTYGIYNNADIMASHICTEERGTRFQLHVQDHRYSISVPIYGEYNISNALAAIAACLSTGYNISDILQAMPGLEGARGRFHFVSGYREKQIILDFANSPDALAHVIRAVKQLPHDRLILMITGLGIREPTRRPLMAEAAEGNADYIVVSVDHPGTEDPQKVIDDVSSGFHNPEPGTIFKEGLREHGVHKALSLAREGDLILLTGICYGGFQIINHKRVPYNELEVIDAYFKKGLYS